MNVAEDAYFTNQYLDRKIRSPRIPSAPSQPRNCSRSDHPSLLLQALKLKSPPHATFSAEADANELHEAITPAQLTYLQRIDDGNRPRPIADYYHPQRKEAFPIFAHNEDEHQHLSNGVRPRRKQAPPFRGYYIDQKKRYDVAEQEAKPHIYTHKTFRLVFAKDKDERFNPADFVFEDPEQKKLDLKEPLLRAFRIVHKKISKDSYKSYDYYRQSMKDDEVSRPIEKVKNRKRKWKLFQHKAKTDSESEPENSASEENPDHYLRATSLGGFVLESYQEPMWNSTKKSKKKALEHRVEEFKNSEDSAGISCQELEADTSEGTLVSPFAKLPNLNPVWNYILSWVAYQQMGAAASNEDNSFSKPFAIASPSCSGNIKSTQKLLKRDKVKNLNLKAKNAMSKWNQQVNSKHTHRGPKSLTYVEESEYPLNFEISDEEAEDAYMLDLGRQLTPYREYTGALTSAHPVGVISHISSLIKSIRVMKIVFAPVDIIQEKFPSLQTAVILIELVIFVWLLYELSLLIDALCMAVRAVCAPMIAVGKFMNRIM